MHCSPTLGAFFATAAILAAQVSQSTSEDTSRILGVIPENKVGSALDSRYEPLRPTQKFRLAFKDTTDPFAFVLAGFYAGIAQWQDDFPEFGEGSAGFGKRFGAAYADQVIGNYMTEAILPTLLHEDPRYFRKESGTKWKRFRYALSRTVITRTDAGTDRFNFSDIAGNAAAAALSNLYYPPGQRSWGATSERFAFQILSDGAFNELIEFWPDMRHAIFRKK